MLAINNYTRAKISTQALIRLADKVLRAHRQSGVEVSLAVIGPTRMRRLNYHYRGTNQATDVLSWPAAEDRLADLVRKNRPASRVKHPKAGARQIKKNSGYLGEILINSQDLAKINKYRPILAEIGQDLDSLLKRQPDYIFYFLFVHGLLHLLGYKDSSRVGRLDMLRRGHEFLVKP